MSKMPDRPKIYAYIDYRQYLSDMFSALKKENPRMSRRSFARHAGSSSPNFLQFIVERKLHLSEGSLAALAGCFGLSARGKRYFQLIVSFDHAKTHGEKDRYFRHIVSAREYGPFKQIQEHQYAYLSHWYMPVIRELAASRAYSGAPQWIVERIIPRISESKVRKGLALLKKLELIYRDERSGRWVQADTVLSTPAEVMSMAVINYYKGILGLGKEAIERFPQSERDIRGVTLGISGETYRQVKILMESTWRQVMALANEPQEVERVYHMGLLLFPMSKGVER